MGFRHLFPRCEMGHFLPTKPRERGGESNRTSGNSLCPLPLTDQARQWENLASFSPHQRPLYLEMGQSVFSFHSKASKAPGIVLFLLFLLCWFNISNSERFPWTTFLPRWKTKSFSSSTCQLKYLLKPKKSYGFLFTLAWKQDLLYILSGISKFLERLPLV